MSLLCSFAMMFSFYRELEWGSIQKYASLQPEGIFTPEFYHIVLYHIYNCSITSVEWGSICSIKVVLCYFCCQLNCLFSCLQQVQDNEKPGREMVPEELSEELPETEIKVDSEDISTKDSLFKVVQTPVSEIDETATLPAQLDRSHTVQLEGYLGRKHDLEAPNKRASNR